MSHRSWVPAGVSGGGTAFTGPGEAPAAAGPGEPHAAAKSTTAAISTTRNGHAGRPRLPLLRYRAQAFIFLPHLKNTLEAGRQSSHTAARPTSQAATNSAVPP